MSNGYGRGMYRNIGDRSSPPPPPPSSIRSYTPPRRGGFDHPNIRPPLSVSDNQPPSRAPYGEPVGNNSTRNYPDMNNLSLNDTRPRSRGNDDYDTRRSGPPPPPPGSYGVSDGRNPEPPTPPPTGGLNRTAFGSNDNESVRKPSVPSYNSAPRSNSNFDGPPGFHSEVPAPRGFNRNGDDSSNRPNIPPPPSYQNDDRDRGRSNFDNGRDSRGRSPPPSNFYDRGNPPTSNSWDQRTGPVNNQDRYDSRPPSNNSYNDRRNEPPPSRDDYRRNDDRFNSRSNYDDRRPQNDYDSRQRQPPYNYYNSAPSRRPYDDDRQDRGSFNERASYNRLPSRNQYDDRREFHPSNRGNNSSYGGNNGSYRSSNQYDSRSGFSRSGGNDVPLGNSRFASHNDYPRQYEDRYEVKRERAPRNYIPENRAIDEMFQDDQTHAVHDGDFSKDADVTVEGGRDFENMKCEKWEEMELHPKVLANINKSGFIYPRKIQKYTIPYVFEGFDIMCQGETGSGKTAAFLIPILHKLLNDKENNVWKYSNRPYCLIISPTRELTNQLYDQAKKFADGTGIRIERSYGEMDVRENARQVSNCDILIGCIGRLLMFIISGELLVGDVKMVVIDEADRLFGETNDKKFFELLGWLPERKVRQTLMFSATLHDRVIQTLAASHMKEECVNIKANSQSNVRITYRVYAAESEIQKGKMLLNYLKSIAKNGKVPRCLVFVSTQEKVNNVALELVESQIPATNIHGGRSQDLRERAITDFKSGKSPILVATDVCARGVDVYDMDYVINMDLPKDKATFIQRCGRTGRIKDGFAVSFYFEPADRMLGGDIAAILENCGQPAPAFLRTGVRPTDYGIQENSYDENSARVASTPTPIISDNSVHEAW